MDARGDREAITNVPSLPAAASVLYGSVPGAGWLHATSVMLGCIGGPRGPLFGGAEL